MRRVNYKSDFDFILRLRDCRGEAIGWPGFDWELCLWSGSRANCMMVRSCGGVTENCFDDGGEVHVVCNSHGLGRGVLRCEFYAQLPDGVYPDGCRLDVTPEELGIELVSGRGDCGSGIEVELTAAVVRGKDAYEYAVEAGYAGSAEDFAADLSVVGAKADRSELSNVLSRASAGGSEAVVPDISLLALRKNEQLLTEAERAQVLENLGRPEMMSFIKQWNEACTYSSGIKFGKYNTETGYFELNEITDITYEEALKIWRLSLHTLAPWLNQNTAMIPYVFGGSGYSNYNAYGHCRTYFPIGSGAGYSAPNLMNAFRGNEVVETLNFFGGYGASLSNSANLMGAFGGCRKLRKILCHIGYPAIDNGTFNSCASLEYLRIRLHINNNSINLSWSPKLELDSIKFMVDDSQWLPADTEHKKTMTITLHPEAYARVTDELFAQALAKNITIAAA